MRGLVATTAVLGVLAIGGLPALALTLAAEETGPDSEPATTLVEDDGRPGPPPWAQGRGQDKDRDEKRPDGMGDDTDGDTDEGTPPWAEGEDRQPPPGWMRNHDGATPHGWAVREWAHCLGDDAGTEEPGETVGPRSDCGEKPVPPGHAPKPAKPEKPR
ncbi:MAG TPA: hypothetical protein VFV40_09500 [Nocardioides sp.]|nr:hypothetical protein [Nocardioides sp.]